MSHEEQVFKAFGKELCTRREELGRSIDDVAAQTRIHRRYIEAIDDGDMSALPQGPYVRAFIREYARAVGLRVPEALGGPSAATPAAQPSRRPTASGTSVIPIPPAAIKATRETARIANAAARSAVKTTENVFKGVSDGAKDTMGVITSKNLWEEAEQVRKERLGMREDRAAEDTASAESLVDPVQEIHPEPLAEPQYERPTEPQPDQQQRAAVAEPPMASYGATVYEETSATEPPRRRRSITGGSISATNMVILALLIVFGLVAYFAITEYKKEKSTTGYTSEDFIPEIPEPAVTEEKPSEPAVTAPDTSPTAVAERQPSDDSLRFRMKATGPVWVSVRADSGAVFQRELKAGDEMHFAAREKFRVSIGNQKALEMTFNGLPLSHLPTIQNSGMVVRNLVLTRDRVSVDGTSAELPIAKSPLPGGTSSATTQKPTTPGTSAGNTVRSGTTPGKTPGTVSKPAGSSGSATPRPAGTQSGTSSGTTNRPKTTKPKTPAPAQSTEIKPIAPMPARP